MLGDSDAGVAADNEIVSWQNAIHTLCTEKKSEIV